MDIKIEIDGKIFKPINDNSCEGINIPCYHCAIKEQCARLFLHAKRGCLAKNVGGTYFVELSIEK